MAHKLHPIIRHDWNYTELKGVSCLSVRWNRQTDGQQTNSITLPLLRMCARDNYSMALASIVSTSPQTQPLIPQMYPDYIVHVRLTFNLYTLHYWAQSTHFRNLLYLACFEVASYKYWKVGPTSGSPLFRGDKAQNWMEGCDGWDFSKCPLYIMSLRVGVRLVWKLCHKKTWVILNTQSDGFRNISRLKPAHATHN